VLTVSSDPRATVSSDPRATVSSDPRATGYTIRRRWPR